MLVAALQCGQKETASPGLKSFSGGTAVRAVHRSVSHELSPGARGQAFEYNATDHVATWRIERMQGGTEETITIKVGSARRRAARATTPGTQPALHCHGRRRGHR